MWLEDALHTVFMLVASVVGGAASVAKYVRSPGTFDVGDWIVGLSYLTIAAMLLWDLRSKAKRIAEARRSRRTAAIREVLRS